MPLAFAAVPFRVAPSDNDVWIYSEDLPGGHYFQSRTHTFYPFNIGSNRFRLGSNIVRAITQDKEGIVWVATDHGGMTLIDKQKRRVQYLLHDPADEHSLSQNSAISLYRDAGGSIWVGTFKKGFNLYHKNIFKFPHYRHAPGEASGWPADDINDFVEDATGNIWIGTNGGGLVYFDRKNNRFTR